jgi:hypothetical protein
MSLNIVLRANEANKLRPVAGNDIYCCLEISKKHLVSMYKKGGTIITALNSSAVTIDCSDTVIALSKPRRFLSTGSLEERLQSKAREIISSLKKTKGRVCEEQLEKTVLIDVKIDDVELPEETIRTLQSTVEEYRYLLYVTIDL